jgi:hypothetical protein
MSRPDTDPFSDPFTHAPLPDDDDGGDVDQGDDQEDDQEDDLLHFAPAFTAQPRAQGARMDQDDRQHGPGPTRTDPFAPAGFGPMSPRSYNGAPDPSAGYGQAPSYNQPYGAPVGFGLPPQQSEVVPEGQLPPVLSHVPGRASWRQIAIAVENEYGQRSNLGHLPASATDAHLIARNKGLPGTFYLTPINEYGQPVDARAMPYPLTIHEHHPAVDAYRRAAAGHAAGGTSAPGAMPYGVPMGGLQPDVVNLLRDQLNAAEAEKAAARAAEAERFNFVLGEVKSAGHSREQLARDALALAAERENKVTDMVSSAMQPVMALMMGAMQMQQQQAAQSLVQMQARADAQLAQTQAMAAQQLAMITGIMSAQQARDQMFFEKFTASEQAAAARAIQWMQSMTESEKIQARASFQEREASRQEHFKALMQLQARQDTAEQMKALGFDIKAMIAEKVEGKAEKPWYEALIEAGTALAPILLQRAGGGDDDDEDEDEDAPHARRALPGGPVPARVAPRPAAGHPAQPPQPQYPWQPDPNRPVSWAVEGVPVERAEATLQEALQAGYLPVVDLQSNTIVGFQPMPQGAEVVDIRDDGDGDDGDDAPFVVEHGAGGGRPAQPQPQAAAPEFVIESGRGAVPYGAPIQGQGAPQPARYPAQPPAYPVQHGSVVPFPRQAPPTAPSAQEEPAGLTERQRAQGVDELRKILGALRATGEHLWPTVILARLKQSPPALAYLGAVGVRQAAVDAGADPGFTDKILTCVRGLVAKFGHLPGEIGDALRSVNVD